MYAPFCALVNATYNRHFSAVMVSCSLTESVWSIADANGMMRLFAATMKITDWIMLFAAPGVFALTATAIGSRLQ